MAGAITNLSESWGNLTTSFASSDLETLGVKLKETLVVSAGDATEIVTLTRHHSLLPRGKGTA